MDLALVAAVGPMGEMGYQNDLPWRLPSDLKHFKRLTKNGVMIMGRKTFESLPGLLPGRVHIVLSRSAPKQQSQPDQVHYVESIEALRHLLEHQYQDKKAFVIGGSEIYKALMPYVTQAYISHVQCDCQADTFFPLSLLSNFPNKTAYPHQIAQNDQYQYEVLLYQL